MGRKKKDSEKERERVFVAVQIPTEMDIALQEKLLAERKKGRRITRQSLIYQLISKFLVEEDSNNMLS